MKALLTLAVLVACDSKATTSDPGGARAEQKSKEYESCGASMHCQDDLRCLEHSCRRSNRSAVGDYNAALGAQLKTRGDLEAAVAAYGAALRSYETDKLALPPDIDCAYGAALAAAKTTEKHAELGARVLHRCVLAVPAGSALRSVALAQLAALTDNGLEPETLRGAKLADRYLTRGPAGPSTDKLAITVTATPLPTGKSWAKVPEKIIGELKQPLIACWTAHNAATKQTELTVTLALKVGFATSSEYEDEGGWYTKIEPATSATEAETCVRAAVEPAIKALKLAETVASKVAITIK
ncbi:MAG: hypothetical protein H0V17_23545 [Deltaproteobacteria bacterium]|nr:hypothetical protein [Deltaproteobacteria bacterium]